MRLQVVERTVFVNDVRYYDWKKHVTIVRRFIVLIIKLPAHRYLSLMMSDKNI